MRFGPVTGVLVVATILFGSIGAAQAASPASPVEFAATDLAGLTGWPDGPLAVNANGDVVGTRLSSGSNSGSELIAWHRGNEYQFPTPISFGGQPAGIDPVGINAADVVAANMSLGGSEYAVAVSLGSGSGSWVHLPRSNQSTGDDAVAISDTGRVVGTDNGLAAEWTPNSSGYVEHRYGSGVELFGIDPQGRALGSILASGSERAATMWRLHSSPVALGEPTPPNVPSGCTGTVSEAPTDAIDSSAGNGNTIISAVGRSMTTVNCSGSITTTSRAVLWHLTLSDGVVTQRSPEQVIASNEGACATAYSIDSAGDVLAGCQGQLTLWTGNGSAPLNDLLQPGDQATWMLKPSVDQLPQMNVAGEVIATATKTDGSVHGLSLLPQPSQIPYKGLILSDSFDRQPIGQLETGIGWDQFTSTLGGALKVEDSNSISKPNALEVDLGHEPSDFAIKYYPNTYAAHTVTFRFLLSKNFHEGPSGYTAISSSETGSTSSKAGLVELVLESGLQLMLAYIDTSGVQRYLYTNQALQVGKPYVISYSERAGATDGSLRLLVDGKQVLDAIGLDLGSSGVGLFKVGNVYTPGGSGASGAMYYDNVTTIASAP